MDKSDLKDMVIDILKGIFDPEIPVNIYDLGLIYEINIDDDYNVKIIMTLTAPNCPMADSLVSEVKTKTGLMQAVKSSEVEIVFDPPWDKSKMSEEALLELGLL